MSSWSRQRQRWVAAAATVVTAAFAVAGSAIFGSIWEQADATQYEAIARGETPNVLQPFASRQLHPLAVRELAALFHRPIEWAFLLVGVLCLLFLLATIFTLMTRQGAAHTVAPCWPARRYPLARVVRGPCVARPLVRCAACRSAPPAGSKTLPGRGLHDAAADGVAGVVPIDPGVSPGCSVARTPLER